MFVVANSALRKETAKRWRGASVFIDMFKGNFFFNSKNTISVPFLLLRKQS